jgi:hypothetical protein
VGGGVGVALAALLLLDVRLAGTGRGLYLLRHGWRWQIADDLYLGDETRFVVGVDVRRLEEEVSGGYSGPRPGLQCDWAVWDGTGWVRNLLPGGRELVTTFSRYVDPVGRHPEGLFIGGRPPPLPGNEGTRVLNQSGMAYYDGNRWFHVWCNANEALESEDGSRTLAIGDWEYLDGEVVLNNSQATELRSRHQAALAGTGLRMERRAAFLAGQPYLVLRVRIVNLGPFPFSFRYGYGDEPWLGEYGNSAGNVGWVDGGLVLVEADLDPTRHRYAGYVDSGNPLLGVSSEDFTHLANFIEWRPESAPSRVYFSNAMGAYPREGEGVPLQGNERALALEWQSIALQPGEAWETALAIGFAGRVLRGQLPVKPPVDFGAERNTHARP